MTLWFSLLLLTPFPLNLILILLQVILYVRMPYSIDDFDDKKQVRA